MLINKKIGLSLALASIILEASVNTTTNSGLAELYADHFESKDNIVYAKGHVVLAYDGTLFLGDKARYNQEKKQIVVEGHVEVLSKNGSKVLADKLVFKTDTNRVLFSDFYHSNRDDIWVYSDYANYQDGNYTMTNSVLSSCSVKDPDWSVKFGKAVYDSKTKYMRLHDVKFYAGKMPVFYTPYLGFSLERQRHSGLLSPHFRNSKYEGFYYEQPYFLAIAPNMDLTLNPAIRTKRGTGIYGTFRFVDSPYSKGEIRTGYFHDRKSFIQNKNLKNENHYGFEFIYESKDFWKGKPKGYRDGFYTNINLFNDIDYGNLQHKQLNHLQATTRFQESRLNYLLYNDKQYFGFNTRYFIDTASKDNKATIQELPALQYHKFSTPLGTDSLQYNVDAQVHNYWRKSGTRAFQESVSLPVEFHSSLMNDYLNFTLEEKFSASDTKFIAGNASSSSKDHYSAFVLYHKAEVSSDLAHSYESGLHTMELSALLIKSTLLAEGDLHYGDIDTTLVRDYNLQMLYKTRLALQMHNFWESYNSPLKLDYLISADYYPGGKDTRWNELHQELNVYYGAYSFTGRFDYSLRDKVISQISGSFGYKVDRLGLSIGYTQQKQKDVTGYLISQKELNFDIRYKANNRITWYGTYNYDFKNKLAKNWKLGLLYDKKCWNVSVVFKDEATPILTRNGRGALHNRSISLQFNLVPFGGIGGSHGKL